MIKKSHSNSEPSWHRCCVERLKSLFPSDNLRVWPQFVYKFLCVIALNKDNKYVWKVVISEKSIEIVSPGKEWQRVQKLVATHFKPIHHLIVWALKTNRSSIIRQIWAKNCHFYDSTSNTDQWSQIRVAFAMSPTFGPILWHQLEKVDERVVQWQQRELWAHRQSKHTKLDPFCLTSLSQKSGDGLTIVSFLLYAITY